MSWNFHNPVSVIFGFGSRSQLLNLITDQVLLVVSSSRGYHQFTSDDILGNLSKKNKLIYLNTVQENPSIQAIEESRDRFIGVDLSGIIGFGGGSALDTAKILQVCLSSSSQYSLMDLIKNPTFCSSNNSLPVYCIPTTSGSGSEVTPFATCWDHVSQRKYSLANNSTWPHFAIVDSQLAYTMPRSVTISTALDAICQALESIWNKNCNRISINYATDSLRLSLIALPRLIDDLSDIEARDHMAEASLLAGLAISHTRTALCHSISYPLTAVYGIPHGIACAFTMSTVLRYNLRYDDGRLSNLVHSLYPDGSHSDLINTIDELVRASNVKPIVREAVGSLHNLLALQDQMLTPGRADNNMTSVDDIEELLVSSWGYN